MRRKSGREVRPPSERSGSGRRPRTDPLYQLATSVQAGETTEFPWALLRCIYFNGGSGAAAARNLRQWASAYGIEVRTERRNAGHRILESDWVRFNYVPPAWMPCC